MATETLKLKKQTLLVGLLCLTTIHGEVHHELHHGDHHHRRHHQVFDLSHPLSSRTPVPEWASPLESSQIEQMMEPVSDDEVELRPRYLDFCMNEKMGTHVNAPLAFSSDKSSSVHELPLHMLVNVPAVVIDPSAVDIPAKNPDAVLTRGDIERWESDHGQIPEHAFVILRTGWSVYFNRSDQFFGNFAGREKPTFPGFDASAASWLLTSRNIIGLGTEAPDVEPPFSNRVKQLLAAKSKISVVQLAPLDRLPARGLTVTIAPLNLVGGSGGPARVFAVKHDHPKKQRLDTTTSPRRPRLEPITEATTATTTKPTTTTTKGHSYQSDEGAKAYGYKNSASTVNIISVTIMAASQIILRLCRE